jgi:hypothetical protein
MKPFYIVLILITLIGCSEVKEQTEAEEREPIKEKTINNKVSWASPFVTDYKNSPFKSEPVEGADIEKRGICWGELKPNDLGERVDQYDYSMMAQMRKLPKLPKAGAHPRILFTAEQIPELRKRLKTTKVGQHMWKAIIGWTEELKGRYDGQAYYAKPDRIKGHFGTHGFIPRFRAGCLKRGEVWKKLIKGDLNFNGFKGIGVEWGIFPLEALRCLIDKDEKSGKLLGKAIDTAMLAYEKDDQKMTDQSPWGKYGLTGFNVAYTYDIAHRWLNPKTKVLMRKFLRATTSLSDHYGAFQGAYATSSNWVTFTYPLIGQLALEGTEDFNELKYLGMLRAYKNFYSYGWYPSGACYEGMGKNQLGGDGLVMFSLRGENIAAHPNALATYFNRIPKDVIPGKDQYIAYDRWGGEKNIPLNDVIALKYLYPQNKKIDWAYKKAIGENFENIGAGRVDMYWNDVLTKAVLVEEPLPVTISQKEAAEGDPNFFCPDRNLMITRSDWSDRALYLHTQNRPVNGGHVFADRSSFAFYGEGESWLIKRPIAYMSEQNNMVLIDDHMHSPYSPGRVVDRMSDQNACFMVSDTKYTWDWNVQTYGVWQKDLGIKQSLRSRLVEGGDYSPMLETPNDFSYEDQSDEYLNQSVYSHRFWHSYREDEWRMDAKKSLLPVEKSFRTIGMVRGKKSKPSYVFVMDDVRVDGEPHKYDWLGQFDHQTVLWKVDESHPKKRTPQDSFTRDLVFFKRPYTNKGDPNDIKNYEPQKDPKKGQAMFLMRFVDIEKSKPLKDIIRYENRGFNTSKNGLVRKIVKIDPKAKPNQVLTITSRAVEPRFKVLLYCYRYGLDPIPETKWDGEQLIVTFPTESERDVFHFPSSKSGKVNLVIKRDHQSMVKLTKKVSPSPDRSHKSDTAQLRIAKPVAHLDFRSGDIRDQVEMTSAPRKPLAVIDQGKGLAKFDKCGIQKMTLDKIPLKDHQQFTVSFMLKSDRAKPGPLAALNIGSWFNFTLGHWNALQFKIFGKDSSTRKTEAYIQDTFIKKTAHVAISYNGSSFALFINGKLQMLTYIDEKIPENVLDISFGQDSGNPFYGLVGEISDVRVFDEKLDVYQIRSLCFDE